PVRTLIRHVVVQILYLFSGATGKVSKDLPVDRDQRVGDHCIRPSRAMVINPNFSTVQASHTKKTNANEIQHDHITERVWIGLRFLGDRWLWVDGDPLVYEAWPEGDQEHQCPLRKRCGALTKEGHWENWDCEEKKSDRPSQVPPQTS
uniref:C-type lectin domain-containing protein n=1 Tax=Labrus bergylta TaxID=56723 RepID=A0A3Q3FG11_9LABR